MTLDDRPVVTSPSRGEGGAPSLSPARANGSAHATAGLSDRGAPGGGVAGAFVTITPTGNAIGLGPPVAIDLRVVLGGPSPWRSILPPRGGGGARGAVGRHEEVATC